MSNPTLYRNGLGQLVDGWVGGRFFESGIEFGFIYIVGPKNHQRSLWRAVANGFDPQNFVKREEAMAFVEAKFKEAYKR